MERPKALLVLSQWIKNSERVIKQDHKRRIYFE